MIYVELEIFFVLLLDGIWIVFEVSYDGLIEIYLMLVIGGMLKRLIYEGGGVSVCGWFDNGWVLYWIMNIFGWILCILCIVDYEILSVIDILYDNVDLVIVFGDGEMLFFMCYGFFMFVDNVVLYCGGCMV